MPRPPPGPLPAPIVDPDTEHRADGPRLHVAAAARRVGVAPSTLRTWDRRYGIGPPATPPAGTAATPPTTSPASISCTAP